MKRGYKVRWRCSNMSNDTQPEIRFPGFTKDWEERKLGDVTAEVFQGINTAGDKVEYSDTGTPILQAKHITGGDVTFDEARFLDKERYSNYFPKYVPVENDILFANIGTIGPSTVVRDESEFLVAWNILKITLKKPEIAEFIQLQLDQLNQKHYFDSVLTGNATKFVNKDEMLRTPISVPTIEEQKKVGAFFSNIQRAITLHQRKLDLLKETKKGFLQKMFPKNGAKVPEIRFPGFTENWEEKKFKEVINSGIKGKAKAEMSGTKSLYLDTNYLNGGVVTYVDSPRDVENDDVLILWDGSQAGTVYYGFSGALGSTLKAYRAKESGAFLYQQLKRNQQIIYDRYRTPNIPHVVKTFTDEFMVSMPSSEEQFKIGTFFKQLDDTIALQQRKLDLLKETKKGFLQKMFV